ncbi:hypothetical protein AB5G42_005258 [Salmonella enterica subsp. enterica serovar Teko]|uniref:hypothetical protein n=1 Tax=Salmonella enterica TaxID=28901 RepID=UPI001079F446|nr:hypothetical protein [Salmonella enterica subsp. enterica serovar Duisburg]EAP0828862.1 hypothetical protein [Salmonella enterica]EBL5124832.1 hypothetical protein [Salmonella enterica subsp. enterica serovar Rubislaw]EDQ5840836.1 hypothetical protein [Salmonella enterica subsp. enterica]EDV3147934.1 hypothetical protein [Salmonella enterica subsp. enterica serovar Chandans]EHT5515227.1 hypothetical protein [Salmonella enterica subsp. enterica serovar Sandiego]
MKSSIFPVVLLSVAVLSGCAVKNDKTRIHGLGLTYHSDIKKLDNGDYITEVEAAPSAGRISGATGAATLNASEYCKAQHKTMQVVKTETDSHLLINGVARLTFRCI